MQRANNFFGFYTEAKLEHNIVFGDLRFNASKQKTNKQIILGDTGADRGDNGKVETREKLSDIFPGDADIAGKKRKKKKKKLF